LSVSLSPAVIGAGNAAAHFLKRQSYNSEASKSVSMTSSNYTPFPFPTVRNPAEINKNFISVLTYR
jgi:hypothetical protein